MRVTTWLIPSALLMVGCAEINSPSTSERATPPDNSAVNRRDAEGEKLTPIDQKENQRDVQISADIRKRVLDEPAMSINARNAKIITADGFVTLRGPVESSEEKENLGKIALSIAGEGHVDNQLEVKGPVSEP